MKNFYLKRALQGLTHLFYPELCEACNHELTGDEKTLCLQCVLQLPRTSFHHIKENRSFRNFTGRVPIERATSFVYFTKEGMMQYILHRFKYKGRSAIGNYLGMLFAEELKKGNWLDTIDGIIPVPLYSKKEYRRGFNQAKLFAEGIASVSGLSVWDKVLMRTKNTETQTHKTRAERIENVRNVFTRKQSEKLKQKHVLLVDDVLTTGATLEACALELLKTKGVKVSIATIALALD